MTELTFAFARTLAKTWDPGDEVVVSRLDHERTVAPAAWAVTDFYACSPYKFLGPRCGAIAGRPELLKQLRPDKLLPSADSVPERFELGTLPYDLLAGTTAAVNFLVGLGASPSDDRRTNLVAALSAIDDHELVLRQRIEQASPASRV